MYDRNIILLVCRNHLVEFIIEEGKFFSLFSFMKEV